MQTKIITTHKTFTYICDGSNFGTIDTGYGHYKFDLDKCKLKMYDGLGLCLIIQLYDKVAKVYFKDKIDLKAALNIL